MACLNNIKDRSIKEYGKRKKIRINSTIDKVYLEKTYEKMALEGWMLEKVAGVRDIYKPIEPCELEFSVINFKSVSYFDYPDQEKELTYQEFCEDSGWTLAAKKGNYFVFYKLKESNVLPVHTDSLIEYHSVMDILKTEMAVYFILAGLMMSQIYLNLKSFGYEDFYYSGFVLNLVNPLFILMGVLIYLPFLIKWTVRNRKRGKDGHELIYDSYKKTKIRNQLFSIIMGLGFTLSILNIINIMVSEILNIKLLLIILVNFIIPVLFAVLLKYKIRKIKSKKSTNIIFFISGFLICWAIALIFTFSLIYSVDYEKSTEILPKNIPLLTHENMGTNLAFNPEHVKVYHSTLVPMAFEYNSFHQGKDEAFCDIEVTYIQATNSWMADKIFERAIYDAQQKLLRDTYDYETESDEQDYIYSLNPGLYGLDGAYNLSSYHTEVILIKGNIIYIIHLDTPIDQEVLERITTVLF